MSPSQQPPDPSLGVSTEPSKKERDKAKVSTSRIKRSTGLLAFIDHSTREGDPEQTRLRGMLDMLPVGIGRVNADGRCLYANAYLADLVDVPAPQLLETGWLSFVHPEDQPRLIEALKEFYHQPQPTVLEYRIIKPSGTTIWLTHRGIPEFDAANRLSSQLMVVLDITDTRQAQAAIHLRDRAIHSLPQGMILTDATLSDNPIVYANEAFLRMTGYSWEEVVGKNCRLLQGRDTNPRTVVTVHEAVTEARPVQVEILNYRKDGTSFWNDLTIAPIISEDGLVRHFVGISNDITNRKQSDRQQLQSQKLEAMGALAGGVAHDFNNILTAVIGHSDLLLLDQPTDPKWIKGLEEIRAAAERAGSLTRQLLTFSRQQPIEIRDVNLNHVVQNMRAMLLRLLNEEIKLETALEVHPLTLKSDSRQLEQVVMNLVLNSRDALPRGGLIRVETSLVEETDAELIRLGLDPAPHMRLSVTDNGTGMSEEIKTHIFEPFFTTKSADAGSGLGLSTCYGIVTRFGGVIDVESALGRGTAFHIYLPCDPEGTPASQPSTHRTAPTGKETILVVEDDPMVRTLVGQILRKRGYELVTSTNGDEALHFLAENPTIVPDLVLTDMVMPEMGGQAMAEEIVKLHPHIRFLFMSGYKDTEIPFELKQGHVGFLDKPFSPTDLAQKVRNILDGKPD